MYFNFRTLVQEFHRLPHDHHPQRRLLRALQRLRSLLDQNGPLVPHFLGLLRADQKILWSQILVVSVLRHQSLAKLIPD